MDDLEKRARRAEEAERMWSSEIMKEARLHIEKALMKGFADTPLRDDEGLMRIRMLYEAHKAYESFFRAAIDDGKMAQLEIKRSMKSRLRSMI